MPGLRRLNGEGHGRLSGLRGIFLILIWLMVTQDYSFVNIQIVYLRTVYLVVCKKKKPIVSVTCMALHNVASLYPCTLHLLTLMCTFPTSRHIYLLAFIECSNVLWPQSFFLYRLLPFFFFKDIYLDCSQVSFRSLHKYYLLSEDSHDNTM